MMMGTGSNTVIAELEGTFGVGRVSGGVSHCIRTQSISTGIAKCYHSWNWS